VIEKDEHPSFCLVLLQGTLEIVINEDLTLTK
jgi:hypothetical protein